MANPNIVNVTTIYGLTNNVNLSTTSETSLLSNAASSGLVYKIDTIMISNTNGSAAANITVNYHSAAALGGTTYPIASTISVPANSTLLVVDKSNSFYLGENTSIGVTAGTANYLTATISYESIAS
jgi:hypothetical protein